MDIRNIKLTVNFIKEGKQIVAYSPSLDLSTVGNTYDQAKKRFEEAVNIFFEDVIKRNVMEEVLAELGWKSELITNNL